MLSEMFGTVAAPLIFIGLVALGILVGVGVSWFLRRSARRGGLVDDPPAHRAGSPEGVPGLGDDSGLSKII